MSDRIGRLGRTYCGRPWDLSHPRAADVSLDDIAISLSRQARFNGHTRELYSVAQHAVIVAQEIYRQTNSPLLALCGLHHDDEECYLGDIIGPLKKMPELSFLRTLCDRTSAAIAEAFGLPWPFPALVKEVDERMCGTEQRDLMLDAVPDAPPYEHLRLLPQESDEQAPVIHMFTTIPCLVPSRARWAYLYTDDWLRERLKAGA